MFSLYFAMCGSMVAWKQQRTIVHLAHGTVALIPYACLKVSVWWSGPIGRLPLRPMTGLERRLARLEADAGTGIDLPVIFVCFTRPDRTESPGLGGHNARLYRPKLGHPCHNPRAGEDVFGAAGQPCRPGCGDPAVLTEPSALLHPLNAATSRPTLEQPSCALT